MGAPEAASQAEARPDAARDRGVARLVELADELTPPSFAAYIDVACHTGMRPGELDALRWTKVDFQNETILVDEQWNAKTRSFTGPK